MSLRRVAQRIRLAARRRPYGRPAVASVEATCERISSEQLSFSRFGDGELAIINGRSIRFQEAHPGLAARLRDVATSEVEGHWVGLPDVFGDLGYLTPRSRYFWWRWRQHHHRHVLETFPAAREYGNAFVSRFYMDWVDKFGAPKRLALVRTLWERQPVLVVEGAQTRFGQGNDLLDAAESVRRVVCPARDAFDFYDEILTAAAEYGRGRLVLLALGPTATVLAHDLHLAGFRALDLGHLDIEYEWMRSGAGSVTPVLGKAAAEAVGDPPDAAISVESGETCCVIGPPAGA